MTIDAEQHVLAGDNAGTAAAIARSCGILDGASQQHNPASNGSISASSASSRPSSSIGADSQDSSRGKAPRLTFTAMAAVTRWVSIHVLLAGVLGSAERHTKNSEHAHAGVYSGSSESGRDGNGASSAGAAVMTGPEFRERVLRADGSIDRRRFTALWPALRVMGRCSPQDKYTIVRGEQSTSHRLPLSTLMRSGVPCCPGSPFMCLDAPIYPNTRLACGLSEWSLLCWHVLPACGTPAPLTLPPCACSPARRS